jgi:predicted transcriptional regulator
VRHVAARVIDSGQSPAHVSDQLDVSLSSVSEALSDDDAHIDELRELDRENTEAFERVRASSVNPNETVR